MMLFLYVVNKQMVFAATVSIPLAVNAVSRPDVSWFFHSCYRLLQVVSRLSSVAWLPVK
jgi:hypothetical protein